MGMFTVITEYSENTNKTKYVYKDNRSLFDFARVIKLCLNDECPLFYKIHTLGGRWATSRA